MDYFVLFIGLEISILNFASKVCSGSIMDAFFLHKISGTLNRIEYPNQGSIQRNGALIFVQIPKCGNPE
jgi:hypothetical protein